MCPQHFRGTGIRPSGGRQSRSEREEEAARDCTGVTALLARSVRAPPYPLREGEATKNRTEQSSWKECRDALRRIRGRTKVVLHWPRCASYGLGVILPDFLAPGLRVVFCGTAAGEKSAERGHYYAGPGNDFWRYLFESGLTPERMEPEDDSRVTEFGIGLSDLAKLVAASSDAGLRGHYDVERLIRKIEAFKPSWVAFHGKEAAKVVSRTLGQRRRVRLGRQTWLVGGRPVFVVPSASGSNRDPRRLEDKASRLEWFIELNGLA